MSSGFKKVPFRKNYFVSSCRCECCHSRNENTISVFVVWKWEWYPKFHLWLADLYNFRTYLVCGMYSADPRVPLIPYFFCLSPIKCWKTRTTDRWRKGVICQTLFRTCEFEKWQFYNILGVCSSLRRINWFCSRYLETEAEQQVSLATGIAFVPVPWLYRNVAGFDTEPFVYKTICKAI